MPRRSDIILVSAFLAATTALAVLARTKQADAPAPADRGPSGEAFAASVAVLLPELEGHVVAGSAKERDGAPACLWDSRTRNARIDGIEQDVLEGTGHRGWTDPEARSLAEPLHDTIAPLRACVSCMPVKSGCADAARALVTLERRLAARKAIAEPGGI